MDWLYELLGHILYGFSCIMPAKSYALALILYALVFKIVFLPFTVKQQKNQIKMAKLAPKIEVIKAKYNGRTDQVSKQKLQQEIMELQQREGASPFAGCLPMLLQFPIIIWLYKVIRSPLSYICGMEQAGWDKLFSRLVNAGVTEETIAGLKGDQLQIVSLIKSSGIEYSDLVTREIPNLKLFRLDLGNTPSLKAGWPLILVCLIPVVAAALQWLTMYVTRKWNSTQQLTQADAQTNMSMKMMDFMMPLMTLFITFSFSALMGLYWIFQSGLAILQTFILSRVMPLPHYTEEELKAMKKEQKQAEKAQKQALKGNVKYKSLHFIDEEDYDTLPTVKTNESDAKKNASLYSERPELKD